MTKILVTGATGFIGGHCLPILADRRIYEIHAVSSRQISTNEANIIWHQANLLDQHQVAKLMSEVQPSHMLHFAWYTIPNEYWTSIENLHWLQASLTLLLEFAKQGGRRVVMAGTCAEYDWTYGFCSEDITPTRPATLYGICKKSLSEVLNHFSKQAGIDNVWGRIFFPYGPCEAEIRLVPYVIRTLLLEQRVYCTHGMQIRDYIYVQDVADAFVTLLETGVEGSVNIASGKPIAIRDIVSFLAKSLGREKLVEFGSLAAHENDAPFVVADVRRMTQEVGWVPKVSLEQGLVATIEWWKQTNLKG